MTKFSHHPQQKPADKMALPLESTGLYSNSAWLIADKLIRLGFGLLVWMLLARQLGPTAFGQWNFAIAFAALFAVVAGLGFDGVLQRELIAEGADVPGLLGTAVILRLVAGCVSAVFCIAAAWWTRSAQPEVVALVALNALAFLLHSSQVVEYLFQARMQNRYSVVALNIAFLAATVLRILLLWYDASLFWFGATLVVEAAFAAVLLILSARRRVDPPISLWRYDQTIARHLLFESWPMLLSGMAVIVYMRIDQVMLASMVGDVAVGQFSAALKLSEVWYFVPAAILSAAFPMLLARRQQGREIYERYLQMLYDSMAWLGLAMAVLVTFTAPWIIDLLYGSEFSGAVQVWQIQTWAGITVAMSYVHSKWLLAEGLQRIGLLYTLAGCAVNLGLNFLLIPNYGAVGAAWATLATQIGLLPMQLFFPETRRNFFMMIRTATAPVRYWKK